jgi:hypothetical protein
MHKHEHFTFDNSLQFSSYALVCFRSFLGGGGKVQLLMGLERGLGGRALGSRTY